MARRQNKTTQEPFLLAYDHAETSADLTVNLFKVPVGKRIRVDGVDYINPTGLAEDATHAFSVKLMNDSTVVASWSTDSDGAAADDSIPADTFIALALNATPSNLVYEADDVMALFLDEGAGATATLPAGRIVVRGRYV
jgi:hypothetical protein